MAYRDAFYQSTWTLPHALEDVADALLDPAAMRRWLSPRCESVHVVGVLPGRGKVLELALRPGALVGPIAMTLLVRRGADRERITVEASGDMAGYAECRLDQTPWGTEVQWELFVRALSPRAKLLRLMGRPLAERLVRVAMERSIRALGEELDARVAARPTIQAWTKGKAATYSKS